MGGRIPFQELLERLREEGRPVGLDDYAAVGRLLARYDGTSRDELRDAFAALLGRDLDGCRRVRALFDELYAEAPAVAAKKPPAERPPEPPKEPRTEPWRVPRAALAGLGLAAVAAASLALLWPDGSERPTSAPPIAVPAPSQEEGPAAPSYAASPLCGAWEPGGGMGWPIAAGAVGFGVALAVASARRLRRERSLARTALRRDRFALAAGPRTYRVAAEPRAFSDEASVLRRAAAQWEPLRDLDVERTVEETTRRGLFTVLVRKRRAGIARLLVLEQTGALARAFRPRFAAFVAALERQGIEVARLFFDDDPALAGATPSGAREPLARVGEHATDRPLVVLGTGELAPTSLRELGRALAPWRARVLLTPLADRSRIATALLAADSPLPTLTLDDRGVRQAAAVLASGPRGGKRGRQAPPLRVLPSQVLRLRAMLAMAPEPSFELAERLRERFVPRAPPDILRAVDSVVSEPAGDDAQAALRWFREMDAVDTPAHPAQRDEAEVRAFLTEILDEVEVDEDDGVAALRWRRDRARMALDAADAPTRTRAAEELVELARGPLRAEAASWLARERASAPAHTAGAFDAVERALAVEEPLGLRLGWARPSLAGAAVAAAIGLGTAAVANLWLDARAAPLELDGSTKILFTDGELLGALCAFDSFAASRTIDGERVLIGTVAPPETDEVLGPGGVPKKRLVMLWIGEGKRWRTARAKDLGTDSFAGPDHIAIGERDEQFVAATAPETYSRKPYYPIAMRDFCIVAAKACSADSFAVYSYPAGAFVGLESGATLLAVDPAGAAELHRQGLAVASEGLLPGSTTDVIERLLDQRPIGGLRVVDARQEAAASAPRVAPPPPKPPPKDPPKPPPKPTVPPPTKCINQAAYDMCVKKSCNPLDQSGEYQRCVTECRAYCNRK
jgi:hypothetical protein